MPEWLEVIIPTRAKEDDDKTGQNSFFFSRSNNSNSSKHTHPLKKKGETDATHYMLNGAGRLVEKYEIVDKLAFVVTKLSAASFPTLKHLTRV